MKPLSDTPRTDKYGGFCAEYHKVNGMTLIQHARQLERENAELHKQRQRDALLGSTAMQADHELITKLLKDLDEATHLNQAVSMLASLPRADEMEYLVKDGKRLDWLEKSDYELYDPNTDSLFSDSSRPAIDEAMQKTYEIYEN